MNLKKSDLIYPVATVVFFWQMYAFKSIYNQFIPIVRTEVVRDTIIQRELVYRDTCINYDVAIGSDNFQAVEPGDYNIAIGYKNGYK